MRSTLLKTVLVGLVIGVIALLSVWLQQPLLAPSIGSAAFVQLMSPREPSATAWNNAVGQFAGVVAGMIGVLATLATGTPTFLGNHPLEMDRVLAVVVAVMLTALFQIATRSTNPAGGATAVVVAIGLETANWQGGLRLVAAILIVTALGEAGRTLVLRVENANSSKD